MNEKGRKPDVVAVIIAVAILFAIYWVADSSSAAPLPAEVESSLAQAYPPGWIEVEKGSATGGGISDNGTGSYVPSIAIGPDGIPHVAWANRSGWGVPNIYVRRWYGGNWVEVGTGSASGGGVSNNDGISTSPSIAIAPDGTPYVAWEEFAAGEICVRRWNGAAWEEVGAGSASGGGISNNLGFSRSPSIAIAPNGTPYIAWDDDSGGNYEIYVRRWNGSSWEEVGSNSASGGGISNNGRSSWAASIAISPSGVPYVAWSDYADGDFETYVRRWNGSMWEEVGFSSASGGGISDNNAGSYYPSLAIAPDGTPYVAWHDRSDGEDYEIYVRRWNGNWWEEVGPSSASGGGVSNNSYTSRRPAMAVGPDNTPYVAWWADTGASDDEIYIKRWIGCGWEYGKWGPVDPNSASGGGISSNNGASWYPALAVGSDNVPYVAWEDNSNGNWEIYVRRNYWRGMAQSARSGEWGNRSTWLPNQVPNRDSVVVIQENHTVTRNSVYPNRVQVQALCNYGRLESDTIMDVWSQGIIFNSGTIRGRDGASIGAVGEYGTGIYLMGCPIYNDDTIQAGNGGSGSTSGGRGGAVWIHNFFTPGPAYIYNEGTIQAGNGGNGSVSGGAGGQILVASRNSAVNVGGIRAGRGGNVVGLASPAWAGNGGNALIGGGWELVNRGLISAGDGGDAPGIPGQEGGDGGKLTLKSRSLILNNGWQFAGRGGRGNPPGQGNQVVMDPTVISLSGPDTRASGKDVIIFGGDGSMMDLSDMSSAAITATNDITLAVGIGGVVDLRGNVGQVFQAGGQVIIASDVISLDTGVDLVDVAGINVVTKPSQILPLRDALLIGPKQEVAEPGDILTITLTLLNGGPVTDTYSLNHSDSAGWSLGSLPSSITVGGLALNDLTLNVTVPADAPSGETNVITVTATSLADPNLTVIEEIQVYIESSKDVYLPLILNTH